MAVGICADLTVLELGSGSIATSLAGMLLADNGARVIKVEPPSGDRLRRLSPSGFLAWNRGKESAVVDLRTPRGRAEARALAERVDVLVEGFADSVAAGFGLGYDELSVGNPGLVYCSVRGFPPGSPHSRLRAYDAVVAAKTGWFTRRRSARPGPHLLAPPLASHGAGQLALQAIVAALIVRDRTGEGQRVETSLLQGLSPLDYFGLMMRQYELAHPERPSGDGKVRATAGALCSEDGRWVLWTTMLRAESEGLTRALGLRWTWDDERFRHAPDFEREEDAAAFGDLLRDRFRKRTWAEWEPLLLAEPDVGFELVATGEEGLRHAQVLHNGHVIEVQDPVLGPVKQVGPVAAFELTPSVVRGSAPALDDLRREISLPAPVRRAGSEAPRHPLEGVTILEFGNFYAMPFACTLAAALGARVIKIEGVGGDPMRHSFGADEVGGAKTTEGKESLAVDLKTEAGQEIVRRLVRRADALVLGFRPGVAERLGIGRETLRDLNPSLVYLHGAGYGPSGPYASRPIYASIAAAVAGAFPRQAGAAVDPSRAAGEDLPTIRALEARISGVADGDANAALALCSALLLALRHQRRTGQGQYAFTSMIGGNAYAYSDDFVAYDGKPAAARPDLDQYGLHALYRLYPASTGWVFLAAPRRREWEALARGLGRPDLLDDPRFAGKDARCEHDAELVAVLTESFSHAPAEVWEERLSSCGVGCAAVYEGTPSEFTLSDPSSRAVGAVAEVVHPLFGAVLRHGPQAHFTRTPARVAAGCLIGQHTGTILAELGYTEHEIARLMRDHVVFGSRSPREVAG
ncbi:CoA transferase [Streptosporangium sp. NPDC002544]|uniref:CaiB/BaiF CoA transferase family protein n=1 Tax=Streptosporangium sp. NPDC002544 TaxID=3154538 RepID=UPI0033308809